MTHWNDVWNDAVKAGTGKLRPAGGDAREHMKDITATQRKSLASLLAAFTDGKIDQATMEAELADGKRVLKAELLAVRAIGRKPAQDAANAFFEVIETAANKGIGGL